MQDKTNKTKQNKYRQSEASLGQTKQSKKIK